MKIFITGATGFIGTHLIKRLAQTDHEMHCLVRETSNVRELEKLGIAMVKGNVTDKDSVLAGMKGCDWVMHLANVYSYWEPDKAMRNQALQEFLDAAKIAYSLRAHDPNSIALLEQVFCHP